MKISSETLSVLKSFTAINPVIYMGNDKNSIQVVKTDKSLIGVFQTAETFDKECCFWNTPQLLATIDTLGGENADLEFDDKFVKVTGDGTSVKYLYTDERVVMKNNPKPVGFARYNRILNKNAEYFEFEIKKDILDKVLKLSKILELETVMIKFDNGNGSIHLVKDENGEGHNFDIEVKGEGSGEIMLNLNNLSIITGDYTVAIETNDIKGKKVKVSKWTNKNIPLFYLVGAKANLKG